MTGSAGSGRRAGECPRSRSPAPLDITGALVLADVSDDEALRDAHTPAATPVVVHAASVGRDHSRAGPTRGLLRARPPTRRSWTLDLTDLTYG